MAYNGRMAFPTIKIDQPTPGPGIAGQSRDDLILGEVVTLTDPANASGNYVWEFVSIPVGSAAVLSGATTDTATFTPDVTGSYLIKVTFNYTEVSVKVAAVRTANRNWRIPAFQEMLEMGSRGWDETMDEILRDLDANVGGGGGGTLDDSYDFGGPGLGRNIVADAGAVTIGGGENADNLLEITKAPAGSFAGSALAVTMGVNATGAGVAITHNAPGVLALSMQGGMALSTLAESGVTPAAALSLSTLGMHTTMPNAELVDVEFDMGRTLQFAGNATLALQRSMVITPPAFESDTATKTITRAATLALTGAPMEGANVAITTRLALDLGGPMAVDSTLSQDAVSITHAPGSGSSAAIDISLEGASVDGQALDIGETAVARTADLITVTRDAAASGRTLFLDHNATNNAIEVRHGGTSGIGLRINLDGSTGTSSALSIIESGAARTNAMALIQRQAASSGVLLSIQNNGTGTAISVSHDSAGGIGSGVLSQLGGAATNAFAFRAIETDGVVRTAPLMSLERQPTPTGPTLRLTHDGPGIGLDIDFSPPSGTAHAIDIDLGGAATGAAAVRVAESAVARTAAMVSLVRDAAASGVVLSVDNNGVGNAISVAHGSGSGFVNGLFINLDGASTSARGILITETAVARAEELIRIDRNAAATGNAFAINNSGTGIGVRIAHSPPSGSAHGLDIQVGGASTSGAGVRVDELAGTNRTNPLMTIDRMADSSGPSMRVTHAGPGIAVDIDFSPPSGSAAGLDLRLAGASTEAQGIVVTESGVARTNPLVALTREALAPGVVLDINSNGAGNAIDVVTQPSSGSSAGLDIRVAGTATGNRGIFIDENAVARSGELLRIDRDAAATGPSVGLNHSGPGIALDIGYSPPSGSAAAIDISLGGAATLSQALVIAEIAATDRTQPLASITRSADSTGIALFVEHAGTNFAIQGRQSTSTGTWAGVSGQVTGASTTGFALQASESGATNRTSGLVQFTRNSTSSGDVLVVDNNGTGDGIFVSHDSAGGTGYGLHVNVTAAAVGAGAIRVVETAVARTAAMVSLVRDAAANAPTLDIAHSGTGICVDVDYDPPSGSGAGIDIELGGASVTATGLRVGETAVARSEDLVVVTRNAAASGNAIRVDNDGSGNGVSITHAQGPGAALSLSLDGAGTSGRAIGIIETSLARTADMISITRTALASGDLFHAVNNGSGHGISITQASGSGSAAGVLVNLTSTSTASYGIRVLESGATVRSNPLLSIARGATSSGQCIDITNDGTGHAIDIEHSPASGTAIALNILITAGTTARAIVIDENAAIANTNDLVTINRDSSSSGVPLLIDNDGSAYGVLVLQGSASGTTAGLAAQVNGTSTVTRGLQVFETGATDRTTDLALISRSATSSGRALGVTCAGPGDAMQVTHSGASGTTYASIVRLTGDATGMRCFRVYETGTTVRTNELMSVERSATSTGSSLEFTHQGPGVCIDMRYNPPSGTAAGLDITLGGDATGSQALVITESAVARTAPMVSITRDALATGVALEIVNNSDGIGIDLNHVPGAGSAAAIDVAVTGAATGAQGILVTESAVDRTSPLVDIQRDSTATGDALSVSHAGSGFALDITGAWRTDQEVALGAGSNATLGAVGSPGPAGTAQVGWLRHDTQNGTSYIPLFR